MNTKVAKTSKASEATKTIKVTGDLRIAGAAAAYRALRDADISKLRKSSDQHAQQLLARWANMTRESKEQLEEVDQHVTEVMTHAESAVVEIGKRFVEVTRKTRKQVELAVGLLSRTGTD